MLMYVELLHDLDCREADTQTWSNRQEHALLPVNPTDSTTGGICLKLYCMKSAKRRNLSSH